MKNLQSLYDEAFAGHRGGWEYLPLDRMIELNGEKTTRAFLVKAIAEHRMRDASGYHAGTFSIDGVGNYPGYATLMTWNGFATPCFERGVCERIAAEFRECGASPIEYVASIDSFRTDDGYGEHSYYGGKDVETPDGTKHLYPLGAEAWVWDEDDPNDDQGKRD